MRKNASRIDANVRRIFGVLCAGAGAFLWAAGARGWGLLLAALGAYLLLTGTLRYCPEYVPFRFGTRHEEAGPITE